MFLLSLFKHGHKTTYDKNFYDLLSLPFHHIYKEVLPQNPQNIKVKDET
jgi:hypothetical protein